jgi:4'-phosphopantetheinyl transferase EntD
MGVQVAFERELTHGWCVGIAIPPDVAGADALARERLVDQECAFAASLSPLRRRTWVGGRVALREALARAGLETEAPVLGDDRGAPRMPPGVCGSVSHKERLAVALVAPDAGAMLGVDVEADVESKVDISRHVLTDAELCELDGLEPSARTRAILLRFSAKEAVYKALDPFVRRFVGFHEVILWPQGDGTARVEPRLPPEEGRFAFEVTWMRIEGYVLTTARIRRA